MMFIDFREGRRDRERDIDWLPLTSTLTQMNLKRKHVP